MPVVCTHERICYRRLTPDPCQDAPYPIRKNPCAEDHNSTITYVPGIQSTCAYFGYQRQYRRWFDLYNSWAWNGKTPEWPLGDVRGQIYWETTQQRWTQRKQRLIDWLKSLKKGLFLPASSHIILIFFSIRFSSPEIHCAICDRPNSAFSTLADQWRWGDSHLEHKTWYLCKQCFPNSSCCSLFLKVVCNRSS